MSERRPAASSRRTKRTRTNAENGSLSHAKPASPSVLNLCNLLPIDVLVLISEFIHYTPRIRVLQRVCKRWREAVYRSFTFLRSRDVNWNWRFVLPRFASITALDLFCIPRSNLPIVLPSLSDLRVTEDEEGGCLCSCITNASGLTVLKLALQHSCPPLTHLLPNSMESLTSLSLCAYSLPAANAYLPRLCHLTLRLNSNNDPKFSVQLILRNHASQLVHLKLRTTVDVGLTASLAELKFPVLRRLKMDIYATDNVSFLRGCPMLTQTRLTLQLANNDSLASVQHLLGVVDSVALRARPTGNTLASLLQHATRLTSIIPVGTFIYEENRHLLFPIASRLQRLSLKGNGEDCASLLASGALLEDLSLENLHIDYDLPILAGPPALVPSKLSINDYL